MMNTTTTTTTWSYKVGLNTLEIQDTIKCSTIYSAMGNTCEM